MLKTLGYIWCCLSYSSWNSGRILDFAAAMVAGDLLALVLLLRMPMCTLASDCIRNLNPWQSCSLFQVWGIREEHVTFLLAHYFPGWTLDFSGPCLSPGLRHRVSELEWEQLSFAKGMARFPKPLQAILQALFQLLMIRQVNPSIKSFGRSWCVLAGIACLANAVDVVSNFPSGSLVSPLWDTLIWVMNPDAESKNKSSQKQVVYGCLVDLFKRHWWIDELGVSFCTSSVLYTELTWTRSQDLTLSCRDWNHLAHYRHLSASRSMSSTLGSYNQTVMCTTQPYAASSTDSRWFNSKFNKIMVFFKWREHLRGVCNVTNSFDLSTHDGGNGDLPWRCLLDTANSTPTNWSAGLNGVAVFCLPLVLPPNHPTRADGLRVLFWRSHMCVDHISSFLHWLLLITWLPSICAGLCSACGGS